MNNSEIKQNIKNYIQEFPSIFIIAIMKTCKLPDHWRIRDINQQLNKKKMNSEWQCVQVMFQCLFFFLFFSIRTVYSCLQLFYNSPIQLAVIQW